MAGRKDDRGKERGEAEKKCELTRKGFEQREWVMVEGRNEGRLI